MPLPNNQININNNNEIRGRIRDLIANETFIKLGTHQRNDSFSLLAANEKIKIGGLSLSLVLDFDPPKQLSFRFYKSESTFDELIGPWLQNKIKEYKNFQGLDVTTSERKSKSEGNIAYFVLKIDWQNWENIEYAEKESVKNLAERLIKFCEDELSGENLEAEIEQFNNDNPKALSDYDLYENRNDNPIPDQDKKTNNTKLQHNLIYFGAPGTGKSRNLNDDVMRLFRNNYERVTFYPTYSYAQFVGTYKPVMKSVNDGKEEISYEFVPGPFLRVLVQALKNQKTNYCLVIEEINRANAAAVFGDVFQLLDRDTNGVSEYKIATSEDVKKYLFKILGKESFNLLFSKNLEQIKITQENLETISISLYIPQNMYIWATMNSADQGVFPMDTAFKRRWSFEYIGIDNNEHDVGQVTIEENNYSWNNVRKLINKLLSELNVNEDKLMGPFFVKAGKDKIISKKLFESKVLMYLWEDAARMIRKNLFGDNIKTYSSLIENWEKQGIEIFKDTINKLNREEINKFYESFVSIENPIVNTDYPEHGDESVDSTTN